MVVCKSCKTVVERGFWVELKGVGGKRILNLYCSEKCAIEHMNGINKLFFQTMEEAYKNRKITQEEFEKLRKLRK